MKDQHYLRQEKDQTYSVLSPCHILARDIPLSALNHAKPQVFTAQQFYRLPMIALILMLSSGTGCRIRSSSAEYEMGDRLKVQ